MAALPTLALAGGAWAAPSATWAQTFGDVKAAVHLVATFQDAQGYAQRLEFWRSAQGHVVRRTGERTELRLSPAADGEDLYQLRNLPGKVAYTVHRVNLYRLGIFTDRWSVQHLLDRPRGAVSLTRLSGAAATIAGQSCTWWRVQPAGAVAQETCWSASLGVPLVLRAGGRDLMRVTRVNRDALPDATLPPGWHELNADEDISPD